MRTRELPVLDEADADLVDRLSVGLGADAARMLAFLLRAEAAGLLGEAASRVDVQVGTGLGSGAVGTAADRLVDAGLVETTDVRTGSDGRPATAWAPAAGVDDSARRADAANAAGLLERAGAARRDGPGSVGAGGTAPDGADPDASVRLGLNWHPNGLHAPFYAAAAAGAYAAHGVDLAIEPFVGSGRAIEALLDGTVDVALTGAASAHRARLRGDPVVPLALLYQRAMATLYTTRQTFGGPFESVEQLRSRRVGMPADSETGLLARLFLAQADVLADVEQVHVGGEAGEVDALAAGRVDAVTGSFTDPAEVRADGGTVDALVLADHFPIYGPALATTESVLADRPAALAGFLAGTTAGWFHAGREPERAVRAIGFEGEPAAREREKFVEAADEFGTGSLVDERGWGWHRPEGWERIELALAGAGLVEP